MSEQDKALKAGLIPVTAVGMTDRESVNLHLNADLIRMVTPPIEKAEPGEVRTHPKQHVVIFYSGDEYVTISQSYEEFLQLWTAARNRSTL